MIDVKVIIPAYNEADAIGKVIAEIPELVSEVIVVNNNSTDNTVKNAKAAGATVLDEPRKGYGFTCLRELDYIAKQAQQPNIIVFLDVDYSDYPEDLTTIVAPILNNNIDFVVGARTEKFREKGSLTPQQIYIFASSQASICFTELGFN